MITFYQIYIYIDIHGIHYRQTSSQPPLFSRPIPVSFNYVGPMNMGMEDGDRRRDLQNKRCGRGAAAWHMSAVG